MMNKSSFLDLFTMPIPYTALPFLFFVTWLLAVPMEGPLLLISNAAGLSLWFLASHVFCLVLFGLFRPAGRLPGLARGGAALCALLTFVLYHHPELAVILLLVMGAAAVPMEIRAALGLLSAPRPLLAAAWCLAVANIALALMQQSLEYTAWPMVFSALPLLTMSAIEPWQSHVDGKLPLPWEYLPFIFVFQVVSGLMYAFLFPVYTTFGWVQGGELLFYIMAVLAAVTIYGRNRDLLLIGGLTLGMVAFAMLQAGGAAFINLSMFAMMAAAGCIDLFLLGLLLQSARPLSAFAFGLAVLCGGIAAGQILNLALGGKGGSIGMAGSMVLNIAALTLFIRHQRRLHAETIVPDEMNAAPLTWIPPEQECLLSERERCVLTLVLQGHNYREAAAQLTISESTVKTYMKRICDKLGASDRKQLLQQLARD